MVKKNMSGVILGSLDTFCNKEYEDFKSYISEWKEYEQDSE